MQWILTYDEFVEWTTLSITLRQSLSSSSKNLCNIWSAISICKYCCFIIRCCTFTPLSSLSPHIKTLCLLLSFCSHTHVYLCNRYMPSAGYELSDTRRYYKHQDRRVPQPCLVATKDWHVGQELRFCTGTLTSLKPKESAQLCKNRRDVGVVWSPRKGCSCVFLGPARFINVSIELFSCVPL